MLWKGLKSSGHPIFGASICHPENEIKRYIESWDVNRKYVDFIYSHMNVVDSKASALLRTNGIYFAIIAFSYGAVGAPVRPKLLPISIVEGVAIAAAALAAFSIILLLSVSWIHWIIKEDISKLSELGDPLWTKKIHLIDGRSTRYRIAWLCSIPTAFLIFALLFLRISGWLS